jgi:hypothetical protein
MEARLDEALLAQAVAYIEAQRHAADTRQVVAAATVAEEPLQTPEALERAVGPAQGSVDTFVEHEPTGQTETSLEALELVVEAAERTTVAEIAAAMDTSVAVVGPASDEPVAATDTVVLGTIASEAPE